MIAKIVEEPKIRVGLIHDKSTIEFSIEKPFTLVPDQGQKIAVHPITKQRWRVTPDSDITIQNLQTLEKYSFPLAEYLRVIPADEANTLTTLHNVTIGIEFHWQRDEDDDFPYTMEFHKTGKNAITAINELPVEKYLQSVISSEMSGNSPIELLKAHTIIARSWLIAQMAVPPHHNYLVCHDDHCQRYQGMRRWTKAAGKAVQETRGEVLTYQDEICDTRYSKSCGGVAENFENCWPPAVVPYCQAIIDEPDSEALPIPDLTNEENVRKWVLTRPPSFCNSKPEELALMLNEYDNEIKDLYRWTVEYTNAEITQLLESKSGKKIGQLKSIKPLKRGPSGRILSIDFIGTTGNIHMDDQLQIRRLLSPSHLYSSCFVVDTEGDNDGVPEKFILHGGGWGHGVGLCQIGAAVMSCRGFNYKQILFHYYRGTELTQWWQ